MSRLTASDEAAVSQSVKHARLVERSRREARIIKHTDPEPKVKAQRTRLEKSLTGWILNHGGEAFSSPFSADHKRCISKIETAINHGGLFALAMPRGHGKSTILKWAVLYCLLTGRRKYVVVIAATAEFAQSIIEFCRQQIQESDTLHAHYPQVTSYARATDGKAIKAKYQLRADGKASGIQWSKNTLVLPEVISVTGESYASNGAILEGHGLTGHIRGKWKDTKTGKVIRPDLVLLDDPQSRESAESESQCNMRERIITGDVLGLAGPKKRIAAVMPCTIVRQGDLAARFLDHDKHPEWQGETCSLVQHWPDEQDGLWADYTVILKEKGLKDATAFYRARRPAMDKGAVMSWKDRIRDGELSALQTAENLLMETGEQFWAEYQNDPRDALAESAPYTLTADLVMSRAANRKPWERPDWAGYVIASTDVNPSYALSTTIPGFGQDQSAAVLWYGLHKLDIPGETSAPELARQLYAELTAHGRELAGQTIRPDLWAIDAGGANFDAVIRFAAESVRLCGIQAHAFTGRAGKNYNEYGRTYPKGQPRREQCHVRQDIKDGRHIRWVVWHADYWREVSQRAWLGDVSAPGACSLYRGGHHEFSQQVCAEKLMGKGDVGGRMMWNWHTVPGKHDFSDCMSQAYAAAAYGGIGTGGRVVRRKYKETRKCKVPIAAL